MALDRVVRLALVDPNLPSLAARLVPVSYDPDARALSPLNDNEVSLGDLQHRLLNIWMRGNLSISEDASANWYFWSNAPADSPQLNLYRGRGTSGAPAAVQAGDSLGRVVFRGSDALGNFDYAGAKILAEAQEVHTALAQGTRLRLATTNVGAAVDTYKWDIDANGALYPDTDNAFDFGVAGTQRIRNIYLNGKLHLGAGYVVAGAGGFTVHDSTDAFTNFQVTDNGDIVAGVRATSFRLSGTQVVSTRKTGWAAWTGAADRATHDTGTATLANVAQSHKALLDDLIAHGLIGA